MKLNYLWIIALVLIFLPIDAFASTINVGLSSNGGIITTSPAGNTPPNANDGNPASAWDSLVQGNFIVDNNFSSAHCIGNITLNKFLFGAGGGVLGLNLSFWNITSNQWQMKTQFGFNDDDPATYFSFNYSEPFNTTAIRLTNFNTTGGGPNVIVYEFEAYNYSCSTLSPPTILTENTFTNATTYHGFTVSANATDTDGASDIASTSIGTTAGTCTLLGNSSSGNNFGISYNCSGTALTSAAVTIGFKDASGGIANTTASANVYPNNAPAGTLVLNTTSGLHFNTNITLSASGITDADSDTLYYEFWQNGTMKQNTTGITYTTDWAEDGLYLIAVNVSDSAGAYAASSSNYLYNLDTVSPMETVTYPSDGSYWSYLNQANLNISISASDSSGLFTHWWNITNTSNPSDLKYSSKYYNISGSPTTHNIVNNSIDLSVLGEGNFTFNTYTADIHTKKSIGNYNVKKDLVSSKLTWKNPTPIASVRLSSAKVPLKNFNTTKLIDRYIFDYNFAPKPNVMRHYEFEVQADKINYLPNSIYPAHFIINDMYWIDFNLNSTYKASYSVKEINSTVYTVAIDTAETSLQFQSIGELNIYTTSQTFVVDSTKPIVYWPAAQLPNGSYIASEALTVNLNFAEENIANWTSYLYSNGIINISQAEQTPSNISSHVYMSRKNGVYFANYTACDKANNCKDSTTLTYYLDSTPPIIKFNYTTTANNTNLSQNYIFASINITETYYNRTWFYLYFNSLINQTIELNGSNSSYTTYNFTSLADGTYSLNSTVRDMPGQQRNTGTYTIVLDTIAPTLINFLANTSTTSGITINVTANITDAMGVKSVWVVMDNTSNITMEGSYHLPIYSASKKTLNIQVFAIDYSGNLMTGNNLSLSWATPAAGTGGGMVASLISYTLKDEYINLTAGRYSVEQSACLIGNDYEGNYLITNNETGKNYCIQCSGQVVTENDVYMCKTCPFGLLDGEQCKLNAINVPIMSILTNLGTLVNSNDPMQGLFILLGVVIIAIFTIGSTVKKRRHI